MISFESDYIAGAHLEVIARLAETNLECVPGYGEDPYCACAREKIRAAVGMPDADVEFLVGGTQTNAIVVSLGEKYDTEGADVSGEIAALKEIKKQQEGYLKEVYADELAGIQKATELMNAIAK